MKCSYFLQVYKGEAKISPVQALACWCCRVCAITQSRATVSTLVSNRLPIQSDHNSEFNHNICVQNWSEKHTAERTSAWSELLIMTNLWKNYFKDLFGLAHMVRFVYLSNLSHNISFKNCVDAGKKKKRSFNMQKQSKPCWLCNNMMYSMNVLWGIYAIMNSLSPWVL